MELRSDRSARHRSAVGPRTRSDSGMTDPLAQCAASRLGRWRFSNVWIFGLIFFQCLDPSSNAVSLRSFIPTQAAFQVPFSPCSVCSNRRNPPFQTRPPKPPGNSPRVLDPPQPSRRRLRRSKGHGHVPFRLPNCRALFSILAPCAAPAGAGWPPLGSGRWPSAVRLRRVHYARTRHTIPIQHRDVMPVAVRFVHGMR